MSEAVIFVKNRRIRLIFPKTINYIPSTRKSKYGQISGLSGQMRLYNEKRDASLRPVFLTINCNQYERKLYFLQRQR